MTITPHRKVGFTNWMQPEAESCMKMVLILSCNVVFLRGILKMVKTNSPLLYCNLAQLFTSIAPMGIWKVFSAQFLHTTVFCWRKAPARCISANYIVQVPVCCQQPLVRWSFSVYPQRIPHFQHPGRLRPWWWSELHRQPAWLCTWRFNIHIWGAVQWIKRLNKVFIHRGKIEFRGPHITTYENLIYHRKFGWSK